MNIVVTGSLGHISQPLTAILLQQGHAVTVVSSNPEKRAAINALGATAAIGSLDDPDFLTDTFTGADAVYTMVPPANYFDHALDLLGYYHTIGNSYVQAIRQAGVTRVVNLSTFGAHLTEGSGILLGAHDVEQLLNKLPANVSITHIRPTSFYYNLYGYVAMIKSAGFIAANYGGDDIIPWVAPVDIAAAVAEELVVSPAGVSVRYVVSEELSGRETARILGEAIGKPDLMWLIIPNWQAQSGLESVGMNPHIAAGMIEMYAGLHSGLLAEDYNRHKPAVMGHVKLAAFAREFAEAFR